MAELAVVAPRRCARRALRDDDERRRLSPRGHALKHRRLALATGLTYHVLEWDGPPATDTTFVLVHGFLDLAFGWHEVAAMLAEHAHVIAPDLRGHGDSDWIGAGGYYHFLDYIPDLDEVIARLAKRRLIIVGHSMGGSVASYWAGTRRDRPAALAMLEGLGPADQSASDLGTRTAAWIEAWRTARGKHKPMASLADAAARLCKHDPRLTSERALLLAEAGTRPHEDGGLVWKHDPLHLTMGPYPFRRDHAAGYWRRVACPVLCVDGAESTLTLPADERASRRAEFANCRHAVIPGAAHMMMRHQPAAVAELLLTCLT